MTQATPDKEYTQEERAVVKALREVIEAIDREPELPGKMPADVKTLLSVDPETVLRSTVRTTKNNIRAYVNMMIGGLGEAKHEN